MVFLEGRESGRLDVRVCNLEEVLHLGCGF